MISITKRARFEPGYGHVVWRPFSFRPGLGRIFPYTQKCKRAKLLLSLPLGFGVFWTIGMGWFE